MDGISVVETGGHRMRLVVAFVAGGDEMRWEMRGYSLTTSERKASGAEDITFYGEPGTSAPQTVVAA